MNTLVRILLPTILSFATSVVCAQETANIGNNVAANTKATTAYAYKTKKLQRAEIDALLAKPDQLLVIDVRRPDELSAIGGFPVYLNVQAKEIEKYLAFIPKNRAIVTVSNHAGRAGAAGDLLASKGFNVAGAIGAQNYEEEGGTLTKILSTPKAANAASSEKKI